MTDIDNDEKKARNERRLKHNNTATTTMRSSQREGELKKDGQRIGKGELKTRRRRSGEELKLGEPGHRGETSPPAETLSGPLLLRMVAEKLRLLFFCLYVEQASLQDFVLSFEKHSQPRDCAAFDFSRGWRFQPHRRTRSSTARGAFGNAEPGSTLT
ncbi:hypothetical protein EJ06DRAFT_62981 [Trichodelitschia bisporula]|uniref:Uncharacterized protein n=1 Tax=Trichodelitschia bisporula TaxID=703511 RepID=A0A6G1HUP6_9PEZI|nr:hypothetical protein EJ06DRAFT_62981 [Trichodelitschia bisporula]